MFSGVVSIFDSLAKQIVIFCFENNSTSVLFEKNKNNLIKQLKSKKNSDKYKLIESLNRTTLNNPCKLVEILNNLFYFDPKNAKLITDYEDYFSKIITIRNNFIHNCGNIKNESEYIAIRKEDVCKLAEKFDMVVDIVLAEIKLAIEQGSSLDAPQTPDLS
jgi:Txe/YoeB family toxin of Txe-Axe toxin-antitoxin module